MITTSFSSLTKKTTSHYQGAQRKMSLKKGEMG